jgi:hypothetical protein
MYETTDTDFADRAIETLRESDVPCYRTGHGYSAHGQLPGMGVSEDQIGIYIERDTDYARANEILLGLGAVRERPLPPRWVFVLVAALLAMLSLWIACAYR